MLKKQGGRRHHAANSFKKNCTKIWWKLLVNNDWEKGWPLGAKTESLAKSCCPTLSRIEVVFLQFEGMVLKNLIHWVRSFRTPADLSSSVFSVLLRQQMPLLSTPWETAKVSMSQQNNKPFLQLFSSYFLASFQIRKKRHIETWATSKSIYFRIFVDNAHCRSTRKLEFWKYLLGRFLEFFWWNYTSII